MKGLHVAQVLLLFSFNMADSTQGHRRTVTYSCALVHYFTTVGDKPDPLTGLWVVEREYHDESKLQPVLGVIHVDCIVRGAHLIGKDPRLQLEGHSSSRTQAQAQRTLTLSPNIRKTQVSI